ncbi:MAG: Rv3235 family protein, partial [bacterium]
RPPTAAWPITSMTTDPAAPRLPAPGPWGARLAPAILEVIAGERPAGQLKRWVSRELHETLSRRHAVALRHPAGKARAPQCRRVRSVRICRPAPNVVEASAVVIGASRARAVAVRLEAVKGRWLATAIETS